MTKCRRAWGVLFALVGAFSAGQISQSVPVAHPGMRSTMAVPQTPQPASPDSQEIQNSAGQIPEPQPSSDDDTLQREVHQQLRADRRFVNVTVTVKNRIVRLQGTVPRKEDRKKALEVASSVPGVHGVKVKLGINPGIGTSGPYSNSPQNAGNRPEGSTVAPNTAGGIGGSAAGSTGGHQPDLNAGAAANPASQTDQFARGTTANQAGASSQAEGGMGINTEPPVSDLAGQIETALHENSSLANDPLTVTVTDSEIILSGSVNNSKERETAKSIVESFAINRKVADKLKITGRKDATSDHVRP